MKIVLIIPPSPWLISDTDLPFLGILYISAYIKKHRASYEVNVCDLSGLQEKDWKIPIGDVYGITGTSPNFPYMKKIIEILKQREPNKLVVVGGAHASSYPQHILDNTKADYVVVGEGEEVMLIVADGVYSGTEIFDLRSMIGGYYKNDIDEIPSPDLEAIDFYRYAKSQTFKYLSGDVKECTVLTARGCPFNCSFCAQHKIWGGNVRYHSVSRVLDEVKYLKNNYGVNLIYFLDDTFILDKNRVLQICEGLKKININWHCLSRVDTCDYMVLKAMKDSGCLQLVFGFESGSNYILGRINKNATVEQAYEAIKKVKNIGMKIRGQLIVGLPFETQETVEETANFIRNAKDVDAFGLHMFQPYPGCDVWENPEKYNYQINKNTDFSTYHTIGQPWRMLTEDMQKQEWYDYLKDVIGERTIEKKGALE